MTTGGGIGLIVVGAILAFAVSDRIGGVDLSLIGWILMGAGALGVVLGLINQNRKSTVSVQEQSTPQGKSVTRKDTQGPSM